MNTLYCTSYTKRYDGTMVPGTDIQYPFRVKRNTTGLRKVQQTWHWHTAPWNQRDPHSNTALSLADFNNEHATRAAVRGSRLTIFVPAAQSRSAEWVATIVPSSPISCFAVSSVFPVLQSQVSRCIVTAMGLVVALHQQNSFKPSLSEVRSLLPAWPKSGT